MRIRNKAQLRNVLKKLNAIPSDRSADFGGVTAAQEALDFVAMLAGIKPVYVLGRGFNDSAWIKGVLQVAVDAKLQIVEGPYWNASPPADDLPDWYVAHTEAAMQEMRAHYICRAKSTAEELVAIGETGEVTVEQEARLLGFPECCVAGHYERQQNYQRIWLDILSKQCGGDAAAMQQQLASGEALEPPDETDRKRFEQSMAVTQAGFTSLNMCATCDATPECPAKKLSARYGELALAIDKGLHQVLRTQAAMAG